MAGELTADQYRAAAKKALAGGDVNSANELIAAGMSLEKPAENVVGTTEDGGRFVQLSNGAVVFTSPNYSTSDPETVKRLMEGDGVKKVVQSTTDKLLIDQNEKFARLSEFQRGTPFLGSYMDEALGAGFSRETMENLPFHLDKLYGSEGKTDSARILSEAMRRERPGETMALNLAGSIPGSVALGAAVGPSVIGSPQSSIIGRAAVGGLLGAGGGATEGAVYGYGEGTDPRSRASEAAKQAAVGGALGGALGAAAPVVSDFIGGLIQRYKQTDVTKIAKEFGVSKDTAKVLKVAFDANDQHAVDRILRAGDEATLADAGSSGIALLDAAGQQGGQPIQIMENAVGARANRSGAVVNSALDDALGPVTGPRQAAREVASATAPARTAAYNAAYSTPIDYGTGQAGDRVLQVLSGIDEKTMRDAAEIANQRLRWKVSQGQLPPNFGRQLLVEASDDGWKFAGEMPNVAQLDELKKALQELAPVDDFGRSLDGGFRASQARAVRDAAVDATGGADGTYAAALKIGGDKIEMDNGLRLGLEMIGATGKSKKTREEVAEQLADMSADGVAMVRRGLRAHIDEALSYVKPIASAPDSENARQAMEALRILGSENSRDKLRLLLGDQEFGRLWPQIEKVIATQEVVAGVAKNSATARRASINRMADEVMEPGVLGTIARNPVSLNSTEKLAQFLTNTTKETDAATRQKIWSEIAQLLSERRGSASTTAALKYINNALAGQQLTSAQSKFIAELLTTGAAVSGIRGVNQSLSAPQ